MEFLRLYERLVRLMGWPVPFEGSGDQKEGVADALQAAARIVWTATMWSRLMEVVEVAVESDSDGARYVPYGLLPEGAAIRCVHSRNPRLVRNDGLLEYLLSGRGLELSFLAGEKVWVELRGAPPKFSMREWDAGTEFYDGDVVVFGRNCWLAVDESTNVVPGTDEDFWVVQTVPEWMGEAVTRGAHAELLRNDGRGDRADVEVRRFDEEIERLVISEEAQQGQHRRIV